MRWERYHRHMVRIVTPPRRSTIRYKFHTAHAKAYQDAQDQGRYVPIGIRRIWFP
jgi:hypothetical protein